MKKIQKGLMVLAMALLVITPMFVLAISPVMAAEPITGWDTTGSGGDAAAVGDEIGLSEQDPRVIIAKIINFAMGFLGIVAVVLILLAGFKWMTAGGDEAKVEEAKKLMTAAVIGLVIILASWGIASMVLTQLIAATQ